MEDTVPVIKTDYVYAARVVRVIDGDTVVLILTKSFRYDFGFRVKVGVEISLEGAFRLAGIDTPELRSPNKNERVLAQAAKDKVIQLLQIGELSVQSHKPLELLEEDKYGRWLCTIQVKTATEVIDVAAVLLKLGLAESYDGKGPKPEWK